MNKCYIGMDPFSFNMPGRCCGTTGGVTEVVSIGTKRTKPSNPISRPYDSMCILHIPSLVP